MKVKYFIEYYNIYVSVKNTILECFTYTRDNTIKTIHKLKRWYNASIQIKRKL